ncbi:MAG: metallophosphoesterase [Clostridia bacterium]|nr:metallophosphoesterase [Clostridia bacterium]
MKLNIENTTIKLPGLKREYHFYHITDAHITHAGAQDSEAERILMEKDIEKYTTTPGLTLPGEAWDMLMEQIKDDPATDALLITGDMFNFFNLSTHRMIRDMFKTCPVEILYTPGNHEFCNPVDVAYTPELQALVRPTDPALDIHVMYHKFYDEFMGGDADFWVRDYGDFLIVGINNEDHDITPSQMDRLKEQASRNLPILLMMHVGVRSDSYIEVIKANWQGLNMYFLFENNDSPMNKAFSDFIRSPESNVAAVIAGHVHAAHAGEYAPGKMQYIAAPLYEKYVRKITVTPC